MKGQERDGSWYGSWGLNYIYGTWSAMCALNAAGVAPTDPRMKRAADWLIGIQNTDGGWGEDGESYKLDYHGYEQAPSTSSQTAWALMGLMAAGLVEHPAVAHGIDYLIDAYAAGAWPVGRDALYRHGLPARVLSALSWLSQVIPAVGARALS